jgi:regulator of protease activity HflC (stomatin/prohibitin superfamily)
MSRVKAGIAGLVVFILGFLILGSWYTIDETERGVVLRTGRLIAVVGPGWHVRIPWVDNVEKFSVVTHKRDYSLNSYSRDQQPAEVSASVTYRLPADQVDQVYRLFYAEENLATRALDPKVAEQFKNVFGRFNAVTAVQERQRLNMEVEQALRKNVKAPIIIETFQIENIDFSSAYEASIEARMQAEVEVQKLRQQAEQAKVNAEIRVTNANAEADAVRAAAKAEADAIALKGEAEARAIAARGQALRDNPQLIDLVTAEKWNGTLPTTMLPNGALPFVNALRSQPLN